MPPAVAKIALNPNQPLIDIEKRGKLNADMVSYDAVFSNI